MKVRGPEREEAVRRFANTPSGHKALVGYLLGRRGEAIRVCLEASGNYSLDVALVLAGQEEIELEVINPQAARHFAQALEQRSKNDPVDSAVLLEYGGAHAVYAVAAAAGAGPASYAPSPGNGRRSPRSGRRCAVAGAPLRFLAVRRPVWCGSWGEPLPTCNAAWHA